MDFFSNVLLGVIKFLGTGFIVVLFYYLGREYSKDHRPKWKNYLMAVICIGILSFLLWGSYGTHTEDSDPLFGGGETVMDFSPTKKERNEYGVKIFLSLLIPALFGIHEGHKIQGERR